VAVRRLIGFSRAVCGLDRSLGTWLSITLELESGTGSAEQNGMFGPFLLYFFL